MKGTGWCVVACCALLGGCGSQQSNDSRTIASTGTEGPIEGRSTLGQALPIPGQPNVLVPFAIETQKGLFELDDPYRRSDVGYRYTYEKSVAAQVAASGRLSGEVRWHNAIVRDLKSGEEWTILDRRGVIGRWEVIAVQRSKDAPWVSRAILFTAVVTDTNRDGVLDNRDARVALLADGDGRKPRAVSPADAQVWSSWYDAEKDLIFLRIARDTNGRWQVHLRR
jgi:hypothetical protein